jgi:hypothetical protein
MVFADHSAGIVPLFAGAGSLPVDAEDMVCVNTPKTTLSDKRKYARITAEHTEKGDSKVIKAARRIYGGLGAKNWRRVGG